MMKPEDYRRAVGSIRWTPAQRRMIEEKLSNKVTASSTEAIDEDEPIRIPDLQTIYEEQELRMKKERKQARMYLLILAAAMLTIGGTVAAVAWSSKKPNQNQEKPEESKSEHLDIESSDTEQDLSTSIIAPNLTDQQDNPEFHGYADNGKGFFFIGNEMGDPDKTPYHTLGLRYFDEASGETVHVCAKPSCLHDGNAFCTATTQQYTTKAGPVYLDGYIYMIAVDNRDAIENGKNMKKYPTVLLRAAQDGTELTQLAVLDNEDDTRVTSTDLIAHRGQLWMVCAYNRTLENFDENMAITSYDSRSKYSIYCYEPEKDKLTVLNTSGELQKDYHPFDFPYPCLKGVGDYVYFQKDNDWRDKIKGAGVFRIQCSNGEIEQVVENKSQSAYTISGDDIFYIVGGKILHRYDLKTGEDKELVTLDELAKSQHPWYTEDMLDKQKASMYLQAILADKEHVYVSWQFIDIRTEVKPEDEANYIFNYMAELDRDGNVLHVANLKEMKNIKYPEELIRHSLVESGYQKDKDTFIKPEDLTEADIQYAIEHHWQPGIDGSIENLRHDGTDFYFSDHITVYRVSREELFGDMNADPLFILNLSW